MEALPILLFYCLFQYFEEKEYQTESKWNETFGSVIFGKEMIRETWSSSQGRFEEARRQEGAPTPWARPYLLGPSRLPRPTSFAYISPRTLKTSEKKIDREFRHRKPLQLPKTSRDPVLAPCRRGDPSQVAIFIIPALSMTRREQFTLGAEGMYQQLCV